MNEFTITVKTFTGPDPDGGVVHFDGEHLDSVLEEAGATLREAGEDYEAGMVPERAGVYWAASDMMHVTISAPTGTAAQQVAREIERRGVVHVAHRDGTRSPRIYYSRVTAGETYGPGAPLLDTMEG